MVVHLANREFAQRQATTALRAFASATTGPLFDPNTANAPDTPDVPVISVSLLPSADLLHGTHRKGATQLLQLVLTVLSDNPDDMDIERLSPGAADVSSEDDAESVSRPQTADSVPAAPGAAPSSGDEVEAETERAAAAVAFGLDPSELPPVDALKKKSPNRSRGVGP